MPGINPEKPMNILARDKQRFFANLEFQINCSSRSGNQINKATQTTVSTPANAMSICGRARIRFVSSLRNSIVRNTHLSAHKRFYVMAEAENQSNKFGINH